MKSLRYTEFLEQHNWMDLDGDGYAEPYIVTVHRPSEMVCRIAARYEEDGIVANKGEVVRIEPALAAIRHKIVGGDFTRTDESGDVYKFTTGLAQRAAAAGVAAISAEDWKLSR